MAKVKLTFRNATNTWQVRGSTDEEKTISSLAESLISQLNLPTTDECIWLGDLVELIGKSVTLYHPRQGILDPEKRVKDYSDLFDETLVVYVDYELSDMLTALQLDTVEERADSGLHSIMRLVVVRWENEYYPIMLPLQLTPQGNIEGSLLSTIVVQQINHIRGVFVDPATVPLGHYYNHRTNVEINPFDRESLIGDLISHGDLLEYRTPYAMPAGEVGAGLDIVIVNDGSETSAARTAPDESLLAEIKISAIEDID